MITNSRETGAYFNGALKDTLASHAHVGDIRGEGLLAAIEFVVDKDKPVFFDSTDKVGPRVAAALMEYGVIARAMPQGDILGFAPPLCLTREEAEKIVSKTAEAVATVFK